MVDPKQAASLPPDAFVTSATAARGGLATLAGQAARMTVLFVSLAVLGRLLTPNDFGLVALALALIGFAELLRDFGLSAAAIQASTLSDAEKSNLFWVNTALGSMLAAAIAVLALPLSIAFSRTELFGIILGLAPVFLLNGIGTQLQAQLSRDFRFATVAVTDIAGQAVGLIVGIAMAVAEFGYWSLVAMQLAASVITLGLRFIVTDWRPTRPSRETSVRQFLTFGLDLGGAQLLTYVANIAPIVTLGAFQSTVVVGLYSRAYQLITVPINQVFAPLTNVALASLSRVDGDRFRSGVRDLALLVSLIGTLSFSLIIGTAAVIVPMLLGGQWEGSVILVQVLGIGALFQTVTYPYYWVFISLGRTRSLLRYNLASKSMLAGLAGIGSAFGATWAAVGFALGLALSWPICAWWLRFELRIDPAVHLLQSLRLLVAGGAASLSTAVVAPALATATNPFIATIASVVVCLVSCATTWTLVGGIADMRRLSALIRRIRAGTR